MGAGEMTRWLNEDEQASWRATIAMVLLLPDRLSRELTKNHELSLPDFEILVKLSEAPEAQMRMSHLADQAFSSRRPTLTRLQSPRKERLHRAPSLQI